MSLTNSLLVAGNVSRLQPGQVHITPSVRNVTKFAVLFFLSLFFQPTLFHIIAAKERCMPGYCVLCLLCTSSFFE